MTCADCHMPYERVGAMKLSSHNVRSPLEMIGVACQKCHSVEEKELRQHVQSIQGRNLELMQRAAEAMTDMLDAILQAKAAGATEAELGEVFDAQRKAMWRLDYISSENSRGFHADQEAARILGESIDYSRRAQAKAIALRAGEPPSTAEIPIEPVKGVSDRADR